MNMESILPVLTKENQTYNWRESMFTTLRLKAVDTCQEQFSWTWNREPWTVSEQVHSAVSSDQTTSSSDSLELETIGQKDTTLKEQN